MSKTRRRRAAARASTQDGDSSLFLCRYLQAIAILLTLQGSICAQIALEKVGEFRTRAGGGAQFQLNNHLVFNASGARLLSQGYQGDLVLWDTKTWHELMRSEAPPMGQTICALHPSKAMVALRRGRWSPSDQDSTGQLHNIQTGATTDICKEPFLDVAFEPSGRRFVARIRTSHGQELLLVSLSPDLKARIERRIAIQKDHYSVLRISDNGDFAFLTLSTSPFGHLRIDLNDQDSKPIAHKGRLLALDSTGSATTWTTSGIHKGGKNLSQGKRLGSVKTSRMRGLVLFAARNDLHTTDLFLLDDTLNRVTTRPYFETQAVSSRGIVALFAHDGPLHIYSTGKHRELGSHIGPATELVWSADSQYLAARGLGAVTVARRSGKVIKRIHGNLGVASGSTGSEFWFADHRSIRRFHASLDETIQSEHLPQGWKINLNHSISHHSNSTFAKDLIALAGGQRFVIRQASNSGTSGPVLFIPKKAEVLQLVRPKHNRATDSARPLRMATHRASQRFALIDATPHQLSGTSLVTSKFFGTLRVYQASGACLYAVATENNLISLDFSPSGQHLAFADAGGLIIVLETEGFTEITRIQAEGLRWLAFLEEDRIISHDGIGLTTWDVARDEPRPISIPAEQALAGASPEFGVAALSPDRAYLALSRGDRVRIYQLKR